MRNIRISQGEYYHVFNRGVNKQNIFHDKDDYFRFLFLVLYFQSPYNFSQVGREVKEFVKHSVLDIANEIIKKRYVELVCFSLLPNHFHLMIKEVDENGIASYMQRILNAYTKYYNTKYQKSGHLFQGPYRAVHIADDHQILYLSAYIHKNHPYGLDYQWSSYQDYVSSNRWGVLLSVEVVKDQFKNSKEYKRFVQTSTAKELKEEIGDL